MIGNNIFPISINDLMKHIFAFWQNQNSKMPEVLDLGIRKENSQKGSIFNSNFVKVPASSV